MSGMPVATRIRKVPSVSVPKYQVALKLSMRVRTLVENRCRNTFCWMASARLSVLDPLPLRKIERHTRVPRNSSKYWSAVFAMQIFLCLDPHKRIPRQRRNVGRAVHQQIAVVVDPDALPGHGQAIRLSSGFHAVRQPRCVHTALSEKYPSCE